MIRTLALLLLLSSPATAQAPDYFYTMEQLTDARNRVHCQRTPTDDSELCAAFRRRFAEEREAEFQREELRRNLAIIEERARLGAAMVGPPRAYTAPPRTMFCDGYAAGDYVSMTCR